MLRRSDGNAGVLVTGSSGMIGTALLHRLVEEGVEAYGVDVVENRWKPSLDDRTEILDLRDRDAFDALPRDIDTIVHLAAHARVHQLVKEPEYSLENLEMTFNLLEHARRSGIPNFVFVSSREVYGNAGGMVFSEDDTTVDRCASPYTASKIGGEAYVRSYGTCYDLSTAIVRLSNVYGRYDPSDRVIPAFIRQSRRGDELTIYGAEKVLDFTYLDDCIAGLMHVLQDFPKIAGETLNISSGEGTSLVELARLIDELTPEDSVISVEPSRPGEVKRYIGDISKANRVLGYRPAYTLEEGLDDTIDWYLDQYLPAREATIPQNQ